jgi:hypothetical protein
MKTIFVGDVHSNHTALYNIIQKFNPVEYHYVLLGDYCDYREEDGRGDYIKTITMIMDLVYKYKCVALLGNHDDKLLRWYCGSKVDMKEGFLNTIEDIDKSTLQQRDDIMLFLNSLSLTYEIIIKGIEYQCAHAYFPYQNEIFARALDTTAGEWKAYKEHCIWGVPRRLNLTTNIEERVFHWNDERYRSRIPKNTIKVCGHYHQIFKDDKFIVLDASPNVAIYIPEDNYFECFI